MTARYVLKDSPDTVEKHFECSIGDQFPPRYNIAPSQPIPIICAGPTGRPAYRLVRWGFVPAWDRDGTWFAKAVVRIRAETALEKQSFQGAWRRRRCLFPMNGFYVWENAKGDRAPRFVGLSRDAPLLAVAGLWEEWMGHDGSEMETAALLTVEADSASNVPRVPLIMKQADYAEWLFADELAAPGLMRFVAAPLPPTVSWAVGARVNNWRSEGADLIHPI